MRASEDFDRNHHGFDIAIKTCGVMPKRLERQVRGDFLSIQFDRLWERIIHGFSRQTAKGKADLIFKICRY
jgi:hypothetical protein